MKKINTVIIAVMTLIAAAACKNTDNKEMPAAAEFEMTDAAEDTVCMLFGGNDGPRCDLSYNLKYAEGKDADFINAIIIKGLFPQAEDSLDIREAACAEMKMIAGDYHRTLKGVTRKSIAEGTFPAASASYRRKVNAYSGVIKGSVLVYSANYEEKAYGETDSLVNEIIFNISLENRALLSLDDIFVPGYKERLAKKITGKMAETYGADGFEGLRKKGFFSDGIPYAPYNFEIKPDAITFVYNPFEAAGRSYGIIRVELSASEMKDIMEKKWTAFFEKK